MISLAMWSQNAGSGKTGPIEPANVLQKFLEHLKVSACKKNYPYPSHQPYVQATCNSTNIHTLYSQMQQKLLLKRVKEHPLPRHFHTVDARIAGCRPWL